MTPIPVQHQGHHDSKRLNGKLHRFMAEGVCFAVLFSYFPSESPEDKTQVRAIKKPHPNSNSSFIANFKQVTKVLSKTYEAVTTPDPLRRCLYNVAEFRYASDGCRPKPPPKNVTGRS